MYIYLLINVWIKSDISQIEGLDVVVNVFLLDLLEEWFVPEEFIESHFLVEEVGLAVLVFCLGLEVPGVGEVGVELVELVVLLLLPEVVVGLPELLPLEARRGVGVVNYMSSCFCVCCWCFLCWIWCSRVWRVLSLR